MNYNKKLAIRIYVGNRMIYGHEAIQHLAGLSKAHFIKATSKKWTKLQVMEYAGCKDIDGKDLYEGDIIQLLDEDDLKSISIALVYGTLHGFAVQSFDPYYITEPTCYCRIIGNVYETPELNKFR